MNFGRLFNPYGASSIGRSIRSGINWSNILNNTPKFDTLYSKTALQVLKTLIFFAFYILRTFRTCDIILMIGDFMYGKN